MDFSFAAIYATGRRKLNVLGEAQNWRCCYCGIRCTGRRDDHDEPTVDHVLPIAAGGLRSWDNEVMACRLCNVGRGAMPARKYLLLVMWKGRWKAHRNARRKYTRRVRTNKRHSTPPLPARTS